MRGMAWSCAQWSSWHPCWLQWSKPLLVETQRPHLCLGLSPLSLLWTKTCFSIEGEIPGYWGSVPEALTATKHHLHSEKHETHFHGGRWKTWNTTMLMPSLGHLPGLWLPEEGLWHQVSQVWSEKLLFKFWEHCHLCVSKSLCFGCMNLFIAWFL